jgi:hypothetical protein
MMSVNKMNYSVRTITKSDYNEWLLYKHYAKRMPSVSYAFGLFDDKLILKGVLTIGKPASNNLCTGVCGDDNSEFVYELNRLCVDDGLPKNTLSWFLSKCLKLITSKMIIVSYADTAMSHNGYIYQATNWIYTGATKERTDINTGDGKHSRHYDKTIDYSENRKNRSSKHRYIMFLGSKTERKVFKKALNYKIEQYPKGQNEKYDSSYTPSVQQVLF